MKSFVIAIFAGLLCATAPVAWADDQNEDQAAPEVEAVPDEPAGDVSPMPEPEQAETADPAAPAEPAAAPPPPVIEGDACSEENKRLWQEYNAAYPPTPAEAFTRVDPCMEQLRRAAEAAAGVNGNN